jgi:glutathione S-transferase
MASELSVYGFETSNNMKVRVALGFKQIPYEFRSIDPADRSEILKLSGQHLTPVMVHDGRVLFDSAAILRYLESNFPDRPRLFGSSHSEQWAIEDEELFARTTLAGPMMEIVHRRVSGGTVDEVMQKRCASDFGKAADRLVKTLAGREWLVGEAMTAADVTAAPVVYRIRHAGLFEIPPEAEALDGWVARVMAYDAG